MLKHPFVCVVCFAVLAVASCSPLINPTSYQAPELKEKGDADVDVTAAQAGLSVQLAYSPLNHFALAGTSTVFGSTSPVKHTDSHSTIGVGFYTPINRNHGEDAQFSFYAKYGFGSTNDGDIYQADSVTTGIYNTKLSFNELQFQPMITWVNDISAVYIGMRVTKLYTHDFMSTDPTRISPGSTGTIEPFFGVRIGFENLKFDYQTGIYAIGNTHTRNNLFRTSDGSLNITIGMAYKFNLKKKHFSIEK